MRINNNISALNTYRQYTANTANTNRSMEKLSSGLRINRAGDDAAGLAISEKMRGQIRGIKMAAKNSQDAISLVQTAEGALTETHSILQRMRELAVQSSSDTNQDVDRGALQSEFAQLQKEIDDIAGQTKFNNMSLLDGKFSGAKIDENSTIFSGSFRSSDVSLVGNAVQGNYTVDYTAGSAASTLTGFTTATVSDTAKAGEYSVTYDAANTKFDVSLNGVALTDVVYTPGANGTTDPASLSFGGVTVNFDTTTNAKTNTTAKTVTVTAATVSTTNTTTGTPAEVATFNADGSVKFATAGFEISKDATSLDTALDGTKNLVIGGGGQLTIQTGANQTETLGVTIGAMDSTTLAIKTTTVDTLENAQTAIDSVNTAISNVSNQRASLGAYQNRLEHKINNLNTSSENLQAAESRIRDVDMAQEMVEFTKNNILLQAAQSMLSQANAQPQGVLQLLQ